MIRILSLVLLTTLLALQYRFWFGDVGRFTQERLAEDIVEKKRELESLVARNDSLRAEVLLLKSDDAALEARARQDLGLVKDGETFYFVPRSD
ncbi:MAG: septum formation initiator family protein [Pseudomonadota bacterium]